MSLTGRVLKGSFLITLGEVGTQVCSLLRNVILARILTKADYGVAAMLGMTVSIFEIGGRLSIEYCLIQSKDGDDPKFMAVAHLLQFLLGVFSGFLIFLAAHPMAVFFDVPEATWALQLLSLIPVLRALTHMDVYRFNRQMSYGPGVLTDVIPQVVTTIAAWPLAYCLRSYAVLVWLFIGKQLASTVASHFVAERKYCWSYDRKFLQSMLSFGWPMLINGFLIFGIMQGDRFAVGIKFSVSELGAYAIAGSLALTPSATLLRLSGSILLPLLSSARNESTRFISRLTTASEIMALFSGCYAIVMIVAGQALVALIFGAKYSDAGTLAAWLGFAQALRLLRNLPTVAAMAKGDSKNLMYSNIFRISGLALAFPLAFAGASLIVIAGCAAVGEAAALIASFWRFSRLHRAPASVYLPAFALAMSFIALSAGYAWFVPSNQSIWLTLVTASALITCFFALHLWLFAESRRLIVLKLGSSIASRLGLATTAGEKTAPTHGPIN
jgi:O-antigen/teichoic acid export membrane protein